MFDTRIKDIQFHLKCKHGYSREAQITTNIIKNSFDFRVFMSAQRDADLIKSNEAWKQSSSSLELIESLKLQSYENKLHGNVNCYPKLSHWLHVQLRSSNELDLLAINYYEHSL